MGGRLADDIAEKDVIEGVASAGVSIYAADPAAFQQWCGRLADRTVQSLNNSAQRVAPELLPHIHTLVERAIREAISRQIRFF